MCQGIISAHLAWPEAQLPGRPSVPWSAWSGTTNEQSEQYKSLKLPIAVCWAAYPERWMRWITCMDIGNGLCVGHGTPFPACAHIDQCRCTLKTDRGLCCRSKLYEARMTSWQTGGGCTCHRSCAAWQGCDPCTGPAPPVPSQMHCRLADV